MTNVNTPILSLPPAIGALAGDEVVPIVQAGTTKKATVNAIASIAIRGTYANNAAALSGGLVVGDVYKTATGELRVVV